MRVLAALSGGVDSAVAAARAREAGHEVTAVHLALSADPDTERAGARGCCSRSDARDARRVADVLAIPFYVWDLAERFQAEVVADFLAGYAAGRTPNPCLRCNERIKFTAVLDRALALGFDAVCTGHYARLVEVGGRRELHRGVDPGKDQSYVLAVCTSEQLAAAMFPLGGARKPDVRIEAAERGLGVADKPDSHDICFIPDGDTAGWLRDRLGTRPGPILDETGAQVGQHQGTHTFTVGQRRGLGLSRPAADGRPRYVLQVRPESNTVRVAPLPDLAVSVVHTGAPVWLCEPAPTRAFAAEVQLRAHADPLAARVSLGEGGLRIELDHPSTAVAPGQAAVLYQGSRVLASATVTGSER